MFLNLSEPTLHVFTFFPVEDKLNIQHTSMDWFLHDNGLRHERVKLFNFSVKLIFVDLLKISNEHKTNFLCKLILSICIPGAEKSLLKYPSLF